MTGQHVPTLLLHDSVINPGSQVCVETCPGVPGFGVDKLKPHDIPPTQPMGPCAPEFSVSTFLLYLLSQPMRLITGSCPRRDLLSISSYVQMGTESQIEASGSCSAMQSTCRRHWVTSGHHDLGRTCHRVDGARDDTQPLTVPRTAPHRVTWPLSAVRGPLNSRGSNGSIGT